MSRNEPDDPDLGGKSLRLQLKLAVNYPVKTQKGGNHLAKSGTVQKEVEIHLAEAGVDRLYKDAWYQGMGVALGGCLVGGLMLALLGHLLKAHARPHEAYSL